MSTGVAGTAPLALALPLTVRMVNPVGATARPLVEAIEAGRVELTLTPQGTLVEQIGNLIKDGPKMIEDFTNSAWFQDVSGQFGGTIKDAIAAFKSCLAEGSSEHQLYESAEVGPLLKSDAYRSLRATVEPFAAALGAPVVWVAGNHDERPALRAGVKVSLLGFEVAPRM